MTTTAKLANDVQPAVAGKPTPQDFQRFWGDRILRTGVGGLGLGAGAAGLYYLARGLSQAIRDRKPEVEEDENPAEAVVPGNKMAGAYDDVAGGIGRALPDSVVDFLKPFTPAVTPKAPNSYDPNVIRSSFGTAATLGAGALGTYGGYKLIQALHNRKKKRDRQAEIDAAEKEYYDALVGPSANKLDGVYDLAGQKAAAEKQANPLEMLTSMWDTAKRVPSAVGGAYVATGLGLGGLAAKLMYDRARERSRAKAVEEAAQSKARIAGILPTYVDPDEIVALKQRAEQAQAG
jgi:hypothetical protein